MRRGTLYSVLSSFLSYLWSKGYPSDLTECLDLKGDRPELAELIDARIPVLEQRLDFFRQPDKYVAESLVTLGAALDQVEKKGGDSVQSRDLPRKLS